MKSSTLHRSNLTKERMSMLENVKFQAKRQVDAGQFVRVNKALELDVLYRSLGKNTLRKSVASAGHLGSDSKKATTRGVYLGFGFLGGAIFLLIVSLVVWASSVPSNKTTIPEAPKVNPSLEVVSEGSESADGLTQEKYVIKSGDTLNKIAFRFYGKYDPKRIEEIKRINNISSPEGLQIGQVLIIPLGK